MMDGAQHNDLRDDYAGPVRPLLLLGPASGRNPAEWPDYAAEYGIGQEDVGALIRLACDAALHHGDADSSAVWAPVHAWRALGQLRAEASVEPLLDLLSTLEDDDTADLELPFVFGMIGPAAIPHLAGFLSDRSHPASPSISAVSALGEIAERHPECRGECVDMLTRLLEPHADRDPFLSGCVVAALIDLGATEVIDTIRDAFRRNAVDITVAGDEEDVEIALGVRDRRATPAPRYAILPDEWSPWAGADRLDSDIHASPRREKIGRNEPCPCGSGKKYKKCCLQ